VNQFQFYWQLGEDLVGQVNQVVADDSLPLGEALALLPWRAFEDPGPAGADAHCTRLAEWAKALAEYRGYLESRIDILRTQSRDWLGIWELWRARAAGTGGREDWDTFIADKRRALGEEADRLRQEVLALEARLRAGGGRP
jgi:hypothetical protein